MSDLKVAGYLLYGMYYSGRYSPLQRNDGPSVVAITMVFCAILWPVHLGFSKRKDTQEKDDE